MSTVSKKKKKRKSNALYTQTAHARRNRELQQIICCLLYCFTARQAIHEVSAITATGIQMYDDNKLQDVLEVSHSVTGLTWFLTEAGASTETGKLTLWMLRLFQ